MPLRTTTPLTEQILAFLTDFEDMFDVPRSMRQLVYRHEYEHFKLAKRRTAALQRERARVRKALWNLEKAEYITAVKRIKGEEEYHLTPKGWMKFATKYAPQLKKNAKETKLPRTIKKDSFVIIFDIPEKYRRFRDTLRDVLLNLGCLPFQKSIFLTTDNATIRFVSRIVANCDLEDRVKILLVKAML